MRDGKSSRHTISPEMTKKIVHLARLPIVIRTYYNLQAHLK